MLTKFDRFFVIIIRKKFFEKKFCLIVYRLLLYSRQLNKIKYTRFYRIPMFANILKYNKNKRKTQRMEERGKGNEKGMKKKAKKALEEE